MAKLFKTKNNDKKAPDNSDINYELIDLIAPTGLKINNGKHPITIGDHFASILGVLRYKFNPRKGWLSRLSNINSSIVTYGFKAIDNSVYIEALNSFIKSKRGEMEHLTDPRLRMQAEDAMHDAMQTMQGIDKNDEMVGLVSTMVMPLGDTTATLDKKIKQAQSVLSGGNMKYRTPSLLHLNALKHVSPFYGLDDTITERFGKVMPISSFVGGFPFASYGFNDGQGYWLGKDASDGLVIVDPWIRGDDRTNSNFIVMGIPGTGKSTIVKKKIKNEFMLGAKVIIIDPEREYKELTNNLGGTWINLGSASKHGINPLQIRQMVTMEDEEEENDVNMLGLPSHLKFLDVFFKLYLDNPGNKVLAILKDALIQVYADFNIDFKTDVSDFKPEDFPIMEDLFNKIVDISRNIENEKVKGIYDDLILLLKDIAMGGDSLIWNTKTNLKANSDIICLDTNDLQDSSESVKRTQYFNMLTWAWDIASRNRDEKYLIIIDEAYLMIDPNVPQSLLFLRNASKRSRKYEIALGIVSHYISDLLDDSIKRYSQTLLDTPCLKYLFGTDGQNLKDTEKLYNLTTAESDLLFSKRRGRCLFIIGSKRMELKVEITEREKNLFGDAGGR